MRQQTEKIVVLILVLMEVGLGVKDSIVSRLKRTIVLILVLMEVGLGVYHKLTKTQKCASLNPCFNGSRSRGL